MAKVVFGLGNPGEEYEATRHNVGFLVLDVLAKRARASFSRSKFVQGHVADAGSDDDRVRLVKPMTFMNLCGPAVRKALEIYECEVGDSLVVVDDFMLPFARLRMRPEGSAGGHNGLRSIEQALGGQRYPRLRVGIGEVPSGRIAADYVLTRWNASERKELPFVVERAADAVEAWISQGIDRAMERYNREPEAPA